MSIDHTPDSLSLCKASEEYKWQPTKPVSGMFKNTNQDNTILSKIRSLLLTWPTDLHNDMKAIFGFRKCGFPMFRQRTLREGVESYPQPLTPGYSLPPSLPTSSPACSRAHIHMWTLWPMPSSTIKSFPLATLRPTISSATALHALG